MIFASDLDQTLIYSKRFVTGENHRVRLIETKDEEEISYMTEKAIDSLKAISQKILFIPTTTRTVAQYQRISLFHNEIVPSYAVVSNGGNIMVKGQLDKGWNEKIHSRIKNECLESHDVLGGFEEIRSEAWVKSLRTADGLFHYCIIEKEHIPKRELEDFSKWLRVNNWHMSLQGRKLYFVPRCVSKWEAIAHIQEREGKETVIAAGDSLLDMPMLDMANYALVPTHGEIMKTYGKTAEEVSTYTFIDKEGIAAAEEILEKVSEILKHSSQIQKRVI
ncbi:MAG: HAD family hydrolase [Bacillota bacterium]